MRGRNRARLLSRKPLGKLRWKFPAPGFLIDISRHNRIGHDADLLKQIAPARRA